MPSTAVVTVLACDIVESTALMSRLGDDAADALRQQLFREWREVIQREGGVVVKTIGDAIMAVFGSSAAQAIPAALGLHSVATSAGKLRVRIGIATGEAAEEDGDWFGTPVVEAFRLCSSAQPDEILLTATTRNVIGSRGNLEFAPAGDLQLKGLPAPVPTFALVHESAPAPRLPSDGGSTAKRRRWWIPVAAGVVVAVGVGLLIASRMSSDDDRASAPDAPALGYTPALTNRTCRETESAGNTAVRCFTLTVPEDRDAPHGRMVRLPVVHAPATNPTTLPELSFAGIVQPVVGSDTRSVADQWSLGVRGESGTDPDLRCAPVLASARARLNMPSDAARAEYDEELDRCATQAKTRGIDLTKYGPSDVADDARDLLIAAKLPRVDLRSYGRGSVVSYAILQRSPSMVRGLLAASPDTASFDPFAQARNAETAMAKLAQNCVQDDTCSKLTPNLTSDLAAARAAIATTPVRVQVTAPDGKPVAVLVDEKRVQEALWIALHDDAVYGLIPNVVKTRDNALVGGYLALHHLDDSPLERTIPQVVWECKRGASSTPAELPAVRSTYPQWSVLADNAASPHCDKWGIPVDPVVADPPTSNAPALVVYGGLEPEASDIERLTNALPNAQLLALQGRVWGDRTSWPPCVAVLRRQFVERPTVPPKAAACGRTAAPTVFVATPAAAAS